jgi:5-methylcytosine-specific restriction protein A
MPTRPPTHKPARLKGPSRPTSTQRGWSRRWQKVRALFLAQNPLCVECQRQGRLTPATVVDHIRPHRGDPILLWDEANFQPLCKRHHDSKTCSADGGFGRARRLL